MRQPADTFRAWVTSCRTLLHPRAALQQLRDEVDAPRRFADLGAHKDRQSSTQLMDADSIATTGTPFVQSSSCLVGDTRLFGETFKFVTAKNASRFLVLLIAFSSPTTLPVLGNDVASSVDRDVNAALPIGKKEGLQADKYAACALSSGGTAGAIDCELNNELSARAAGKGR